ncbi:Serine/threonine-protein kinase [Apiospora arundinis]
MSIPKTASLALRLNMQPGNFLRSPRRIFINYCSSGTITAKLARKLSKDLTHIADATPSIGSVIPVQALDALTKARPVPEDVIVIVTSNTRKGEMPLNSATFMRGMQGSHFRISSSFAIFGNGSKDYTDTFCQTAVDLEKSLASAFDTRKWIKAEVRELQRGESNTSIKLVGLGLQQGRSYPFMSYVSILPSNDEVTVRSLLGSLKIRADEHVQFAGNITTEEFFRFFADIQQPFKHMEWAADMADLAAMKQSQQQLDLDKISILPVCEAVTRLPADWRYWASLEDLCSAVPRIQPRKYSVASYPGYYNHSAAANKLAEASRPGSNSSCNSSSVIELLVQHHAGGVFSDRFLRSPSSGTAKTVACRVEKVVHLESLANAVQRPLILFATGSGLAPIRCLLQHRAHLLKAQSQSQSHGAQPQAQGQHAPISLFLGHRGEDEALVQESLAEARALGLFDVLKVVHSNPQKRRAQDAVFAANDDGGVDLEALLVKKIKSGGAFVFACARAEAEQGFLANLTALLGRDTREALGERYVADVYQSAI